MARILITHGLKFEYSKVFETVDKDGRPNHREVDFWLLEPADIIWCPDGLQAIEVKGGRLDLRCFYQKEELNRAGINTWIATPGYISFWERFGFLKKDGLRERSRRGNT